MDLRAVEDSGQAPAGTFKVIAPSRRAVHHVVNLMGRVRTCSPKVDAPALAGYAVC